MSPYFKTCTRVMPGRASDPMWFLSLRRIRLSYKGDGPNEIYIIDAVSQCQTESAQSGFARALMCAASNCVLAGTI